MRIVKLSRTTKEAGVVRVPEDAMYVAIDIANDIMKHVRWKFSREVLPGYKKPEHIGIEPEPIATERKMIFDHPYFDGVGINVIIHSRRGRLGDPNGFAYFYGISDNMLLGTIYISLSPERWIPKNMFDPNIIQNSDFWGQIRDRILTTLRHELAHLCDPLVLKRYAKPLYETHKEHNQAPLTPVISNVLRKLLGEEPANSPGYAAHLAQPAAPSEKSVDGNQRMHQYRSSPEEVNATITSTIAYIWSAFLHHILSGRPQVAQRILQAVESAARNPSLAFEFHHDDVKSTPRVSKAISKQYSKLALWMREQLDEARSKQFEVAASVTPAAQPEMPATKNDYAWQYIRHLQEDEEFDESMAEEVVQIRLDFLHALRKSDFQEAKDILDQTEASVRRANKEILTSPESLKDMAVSNPQIITITQQLAKLARWMRRKLIRDIQTKQTEIAASRTTKIPREKTGSETGWLKTASPTVDEEIASLISELQGQAERDVDRMTRHELIVEINRLLLQHPDANYIRQSIRAAQKAERITDPSLRIFLRSLRDDAKARKPRKHGDEAMVGQEHLQYPEPKGGAYMPPTWLDRSRMR